MIDLPSFETEWRLSPLHPVGSETGLGCQLGYLDVFLKALLKITAPGGVFVLTAQVLGGPGTQGSLQLLVWSWGQDLTCSGTWPDGPRKRAVLYGPHRGLSSVPPGPHNVSGPPGAGPVAGGVPSLWDVSAFLPCYGPQAPPRRALEASAEHLTALVGINDSPLQGLSHLCA